MRLAKFSPVICNMDFFIVHVLSERISFDRRVTLFGGYCELYDFLQPFVLLERNMCLQVKHAKNVSWEVTSQK